MTTLNIKSFATLVSDQVAAIQSAAAGLVDLTIGSLLLAVAESTGGVVQWIQQLMVTLLVTTRAATCSGADLDSWMGDFGFTRLSAVQATGQCTFARFTATTQGLVPVGSIVATTDGTQQYAVVVDTSNAAYSAALAGYILPIGTSSVTVPVLASTAGAAGNATAGAVQTIVGGIAGIATVTNAAAFANGEDAEIDSTFRSRFVLWISSLSKGTLAAIGYAIASMQQGAAYKLVENQDYSGNTLYGYFYAVVDDGSGTPSSTFLASASSAIDLARPFCSRFGVFAPTVVPATIAMTLTVDPAATRATVVTLVQTALQSYINTLSLGQLLPYSKIAQIAYDASSYVTNVTGVTLNGSTADLAASAKQVIKISTLSVA